GAEPIVNSTRANGREDHLLARAEMLPARGAHAQGADRAEGRRWPDRRMHGSPHRDRYPEPAEPDRRRARIELARGRPPDIPHPEKPMTGLMLRGSKGR